MRRFKIVRDLYAESEAWVSLIGKLSKLGGSAFLGEVNLHDYTDLMERFLKVYLSLKKYASS